MLCALSDTNTRSCKVSDTSTTYKATKIHWLYLNHSGLQPASCEEVKVTMVLFICVLTYLVLQFVIEWLISVCDGLSDHLLNTF